MLIPLQNKPTSELDKLKRVDVIGLKLNTTGASPVVFSFNMLLEQLPSTDKYEIADDLLAKVDQVQFRYTFDGKITVGTWQVASGTSTIKQDKNNLNKNSYVKTKKAELYKDTDEDRLKCISAVNFKIAETLQLSVAHQGSKNLLYYAVYFSDYVKLFNESISSIIEHGPINFDVLLITDESTREEISKLSVAKKIKFKYYMTGTPRDGVEASRNKLKIFDYYDIDQYENILFLDCDVAANKKINWIFSQNIIPGILHVVGNQHSDDFKKFRTSTYGFRVLPEQFVGEMLSAKQAPFNAGQFLFTNSVQMRRHFENVNWFIDNWSGEYFFEQSFMNYYFCKAKLTDQSILSRAVQIIFNNDTIKQAKKFTLTHYAGDPVNAKKKLSRLSASKEHPTVLKIKETVQHKIKGLHNKIKEYLALRKFDPLQYAFFNSDLREMDSDGLKKHYLNHGLKGSRRLHDPLFDKSFFISYNKLPKTSTYHDYLKDIRKIKSREVLSQVAEFKKVKKENSLLLVSHENSIFGATHYLYSLFKLIKKNYPAKNVLVAETQYNEALFKKYDLLDSDVLFYKNDPTLLFHICEEFKPNCIYLNSTNITYKAVEKYLDRSKVLFHSHEIKRHYESVGLANPDYVVASRISEQYESRPMIQPPFLTEDIMSLIDGCEANYHVSNQFGSMDNKKITIGMSGALNSRKNPELFAKLANEFSEYNFVWIGGSKFETELPVRNLYHVKNTLMPFEYYKALDYFLLTSTIDPCPYVVLENLYINNKVITFKPNIYTDHTLGDLGGLYFESADAVGFDSGVAAISRYVTGKKNKIDYRGKEYVLNNFGAPKKEFLEKILL